MILMFNNTNPYMASGAILQTPFFKVSDPLSENPGSAPASGRKYCTLKLFIYSQSQLFF